MRAALLALFAAAGCNLILGNGNFKTGTSGDDAGPGDAAVDADFDMCAARGLPPTSLSGTVYAPNGTLPLYGAAVYVPTTDLATIHDGVGSPACVSGSPLALTHSDAKGQFKLTNVPSGDVKLVVQIGKWRREGVVVSGVQACMDNPVVASLTHLPKASAEGTLPHIAFSTGAADTMECIARDLGIDASEIGTGAAFTGHVHLYFENGASTMAGSGSGSGSGSGQALDPVTELRPASALSKYDYAMYGCPGAPSTTLSGSDAATLKSWADAGGWLFLTHYEYAWLGVAPAPWPTMATFNPGATGQTTVDTIDTSVPIGLTFAEWLVNVNASTTMGQMTVTSSRTSCQSIDASQTTRRIYLDPTLNAGATGIQSFTWDSAGGGRVTFDDVHVGNASGTGAYPTECPPTPEAQERAIMFQMFEMRTCDQP